MRGFSINGAKVSEKHTNFIINYNKTASRDIIFLIELIKRRAKLEFGIDLETEITII
jgi:UDP-N-acetylmuramate dehydrogenase